MALVTVDSHPASVLTSPAASIKDPGFANCFMARFADWIVPPFTATRAPEFKKARAVAFPMPLEDPVMRTALPSKFILVSPLNSILSGVVVSKILADAVYADRFIRNH